MLGKLAVVLVLCQIVAFTYGGVLRPQTSDEETCSKVYVNCTEHEDCCGVLRCLDFGNGMHCLYGTDNPQRKQVGNAAQPPLDLIKNLGCSLFAQTCEVLEDCCAPYVCSVDGTCLEPDQDPYGLGFPGFPGK